MKFTNRSKHILNQQHDLLDSSNFIQKFSMQTLIIEIQARVLKFRNDATNIR